MALTKITIRNLKRQYIIPIIDILLHTFQLATWSTWCLLCNPKFHPHTFPQPQFCIQQRRPQRHEDVGSSHIRSHTRWSKPQDPLLRNP